MTIIKPEWRQLTEEELNGRMLKHFTSIVKTAEGICDHAEQDTAAHPCQRCVKTVRHVLETWALIMQLRGGQAAQVEKRTQRLIMIELHNAYKVASSVLDPDQSVAIEGFGPL